MSSTNISAVGLTRLRSILFIAASAAATLPHGAVAGQRNIVAPPGSATFGTRVTALPNGNYVIVDGGDADSDGATYLYDASGTMISKLSGAVGDIYVVGESNFVVCNPYWRDDTHVLNAQGAATWVDGSLGLDGEVSASNSLIGTRTSDMVCEGGVAVLANGHYVVSSPYFNGDSASAVGAATWCDADGGCSGTISADNSLIGSSGLDQVGGGSASGQPPYGIRALQDGDYVVSSPQWTRDGAVFAGAVTLCRGDGSCTGLVSTANSLVGSTTYDSIGSSTFFGFSTSGITILANGNFVVDSPYWHDGGDTHLGAVTWVDGHDGLLGEVSADNSLIGTHGEDLNGTTVTALTNGNYVISSPGWDFGDLVDVGAATWCDGSTGCRGTIGPATSLIGSVASDRVGSRPAAALTDGNYVVASPFWSNNGHANAGAATWCDGGHGCAGPLSGDDSLIGATDWDLVGMDGATPLRNGEYVVTSPSWNGSAPQIGAVTFCGGDTACVGTVTASNSLIGSSSGDFEGSTPSAPSVIALTNGDYVAVSKFWENDQGAAVGAMTWGDGGRGIVGTVSSANSFTGIPDDGPVPGLQFAAVAGGSYIVRCPYWSEGDLSHVGAIALLRGYGPQSGQIDASNSVIGSVAEQGASLSFDYDAARDTLVVGKPMENVVTLMQIDVLFGSGFD